MKHVLLKKKQKKNQQKTVKIKPVEISGIKICFSTANPKSAMV